MTIRETQIRAKQWYDKYGIYRNFYKPNKRFTTSRFVKDELRFGFVDTDVHYSRSWLSSEFEPAKEIFKTKDGNEFFVMGSCCYEDMQKYEQPYLLQNYSPLYGALSLEVPTYTRYNIESISVELRYADLAGVSLIRTSEKSKWCMRKLSEDSFVDNLHKDYMFEYLQYLFGYIPEQV